MKSVFGSGEGIAAKRQREEWLAFLVCCMRSMQRQKAGLCERLNRT